MQLLLFLLISWCAISVSSFDLGPLVRIAKCRSQCIREYSVDGSCDWYTNRVEATCSECWANCESVEYEWEEAKFMCEGNQNRPCPTCETACKYHKNTPKEELMPSILPAPRKGLVVLGKYDVAVVLRKIYKKWSVLGYYPGERAPTLRPDTWIIAVVEGGLQHYSWEEWVPTLECLKEGPSFYEATISWTDVDIQLRQQQAMEQKRFNDRVRQFFLEKYGKKVLSEWRNQGQESVIPPDTFKRFFFKRKNDHNEEEPIDDNSKPYTADYLLDTDNDDNYDSKQMFLVSWEPETGGLMGNQVVDSTTAQISLLPHTKYLVRIASNEGPGSFPIEIDTRPHNVKIVRLKKNFDLTVNVAILSAALCMSLIIFLCAIIALIRRRINHKMEENV